MVKLTRIKTKEVVITVTMPMSSTDLLYETYPLDKRVMVDVVAELKLPMHVRDLGPSNGVGMQIRFEKSSF